jgi:hypothetical protein
VRHQATIRSRDAAARLGLGAPPLAKNNSVDICASIATLHRIVSMCHELAVVSTRKIWMQVFGRWRRIVPLVCHLRGSPTQV